MHGSGAVPVSKTNRDTSRTDDHGLKTEFFVWGSDKHGALGQNSGKKKYAAPRPCYFVGAESVKQVSCGDQHMIILTTDGLVYSCGNNSGKQLGIKGPDLKIPTLIESLVFSSEIQNRVIEVCCANSFSLAVTASGLVFAWGTNLYGAMGLGRQLTSVDSPTLIA